MTFPVERNISTIRRAKHCRTAGPQRGAPIPERRRGEAHRRWGGLEGFTPPHRFKARTAAFDGHCASTRAARSAGLIFAVRSLSKAIDRETTSSGACVGTSSTADAVPLPLRGEGLNARKSGRDFPCRVRHFACPASEALPRCRTVSGCSLSRARFCLHLEGKGDRLRWMRCI